MAIELTSIIGKTSLSASRININDNFITIKEAINDLIDIVNISDSSIITNTINTNSIIISGDSITNAVTINAGNLKITTGNLVLGLSGQIEMGSNIFINKIPKNMGTSTIYELNLSGSAVGTNSLIKTILLPKAITTEISAIVTPSEGTIVYDSTTKSLKLYNGTEWKVISFTV